MDCAGAVSLVQPLDREQQDEHNFTVEVWDHGQPRLPAQRPATVSIHVTDVNDSPPRFEHELYNTTLLLPTYTGVRVVQVAAHDADLEGPSLRYALVAGDHEGHFEVTCCILTQYGCTLMYYCLAFLDTANTHYD